MSFRQQLPFWIRIVLAVVVMYACVLMALAEVPAAKSAKQSAFPQFGICLPGYCYEVHDGDTAYVEFKFRAHIRLLDCWAPELDEPSGAASRDELKKIAEGKVVRVWVPAEAMLHAVREDQRDIGDLTSMGRVLGMMALDGAKETLSEHQVRKGLASSAKGLPLGK